MTGILLGGAGGFYAGRQGRINGADAQVERTAGMMERGLAEARQGGPTTKAGAVAGVGKHGKVLIPLGSPPEQTLRNILAIPDSVDRMAALRDWCRNLPPDQVLAVLKEFKDMMEAQERVGEVEAASLFFQSIDVIAQSLLEQGPEKVLETFLAPEGEGGDADLRHGLGGEIFKKWAERDPAAARAMLETRLSGGRDGQVETELSKHLMRAWIKKEPDAAMGWLLKQPDEIGNDVVSPAFQALSHVDPDKARALVEAQADLPGRDEIAATIAEWWAKTTPDQAMEWAKGLPEKLAGPSVKKAMETWAGKDFPSAKQALEAMSGAAREAALPVLVEHWQKDNWSEAAAFLEQQEAGKGRKEAVGQLIRHWADGDQQAASAWLAKQSAGPERDAGAAALAEEVRGSDPEAAAIWGATLGDARQRQRSLRDTFQAWYKKSVPEALRWLESAPNISVSDRTALMGGLPAAEAEE